MKLLIGSTATTLRLEVVDQLVDKSQMHFQAVQGGPRRVDAQQSCVHPLPQILTDGTKIADKLTLGFLK